MASKKSKLSEFRPVHRCVYCSSFLKGKGKLLDCLHLICENCLNISQNTFGMYLILFLSSLV